MPEKESSQPLTRKYFENTLHTALEEYSKSIIEAVDFGFEKAKEDRLEMKKDIQDIKGDIQDIRGDIKNVRDKLHSLEKRVAYIEEVITGHSKDLRQIKKMLSYLKKQQKVDREKVIELEERINRFEAKYIS